MAGRIGAAIHRVSSLRAAAGAERGAGLAGSDARHHLDDSGYRLPSSGKLAAKSHFGLCCELRCDSVGRYFPGSAHLAAPKPPGHAEPIVTRGSHALGLQHLGFRLLVLEVGCRRTIPEILAPLTHRWCVPVPANGLGSRPSQGNGRGSMEPRLCRLPVSRLQHQHCLFAYRCSCAVALAKTLMMIQASISLATIALLAARAVNIL